MPIRQPYSYTQPVNPFRKRVTVFGSILIAVLAISLILFLADAGKGYRIVTIDQDEYEIETTLTREKAEEIARKILRTGRGTIVLRDIRLPNGVMTVTYIDSESLATFLETEQESTTIVNRWSRDFMFTPIEDEDTNSVAVCVEFTYREICDALQDPDLENRRFALHRETTLSNGKTVSCGLEFSELETYRRRMHCIGASKVVIPFYFSLDGIRPPIGVYRIL